MTFDFEMATGVERRLAAQKPLPLVGKLSREFIFFCARITTKKK